MPFSGRTVSFHGSVNGDHGSGGLLWIASRAATIVTRAPGPQRAPPISPRTLSTTSVAPPAQPAAAAKGALRPDAGALLEAWRRADPARTYDAEDAARLLFSPPLSPGGAASSAPSGYPPPTLGAPIPGPPPPASCPASSLSASEAAEVLSSPLGRRLFAAASLRPASWAARSREEAVAERAAARAHAIAGDAVRGFARALQEAAQAVAAEAASARAAPPRPAADPSTSSSDPSISTPSSTPTPSFPAPSSIPTPPFSAPTSTPTVAAALRSMYADPRNAALLHALVALARGGASGAVAAAPGGGGLAAPRRRAPPPDAGDAALALEAVRLAGMASAGDPPPATAARALERAGWARGGHEALLREAVGHADATFPPDLEALARRLDEDPPPDPDAGRRLDLRHAPCLAVDDASTTEVDDAVGVLRLRSRGDAAAQDADTDRETAGAVTGPVSALLSPHPSAKWRVFVHVADPTRWVAPESPLAAEAARRGATAYAPGGSVPMFPRSLAAGAFSLRPGVGELPALSLLIDVAEDGQILGTHIAPSVVAGVRRLTYHEVDDALADVEREEEGEGEGRGEGQEEGRKEGSVQVPSTRQDGGVVAAVGPTSGPTALSAPASAAPGAASAACHAPLAGAELSAQLGELLAVAQARREHRVARGAETLSLLEADLVPDAARRTVSVRGADSRESPSHLLVSELMIMAGAATAGLAAARFPGLAVPFRGQPAPVPPSEAELAEHPEGPARDALRRSRMLRGFASPSAPAAHAGLGLDAYLQVTSPIRRYGDLLTHWQLKSALRGEGSPPMSLARVEATLRETVAASLRAQRLQRAADAYWTARYFEGALALGLRGASGGGARAAQGGVAVGDAPAHVEVEPQQQQQEQQQQEQQQQQQQEQQYPQDHQQGRQCPSSAVLASAVHTTADAATIRTRQPPRARLLPVWEGMLLMWAGDQTSGAGRVQLLPGGIEALAAVPFPARPGDRLLVTCTHADARAGTWTLQALPLPGGGRGTAAGGGGDATVSRPALDGSTYFYAPMEVPVPDDETFSMTA